MPDAYLVRPDRGFARQIIQLGGGSLKQCYQCATCSVACALSPAENPFPRKEMIWAQWGLKDKLLGNPDVWLCHRCSDCTVQCPRGARPSDVLAAVRDYAISHYSFPGFMGTALGSAGLLPLMLGIPAVLILVLLAVMGHLQIPTGEVEYAHFFPHLPLQLFFGGFIGWAFLASLVGAVRFWKDLERDALTARRGSGIAESLRGAVKDILTHGRFRECVEKKGRYYSHLLTFYGFLGLVVVTTGVVVSKYVFHYYPLGLWHPLKVLGNLSTVAMAIGLLWILRDRTSARHTSEVSTRSDWTFIGILLTVVLTGIVTEVLRFVDVAALAYPVYFIHLVVVFALLIYLPYSRFAHLIYRTVALVHARYSGREVAAGTA